MPSKSLITQQSVTSAKADFAKEMRRQMTPAEKKLWKRLHSSRLEGFHFRRQQVIEPYIVDFYCHQTALVVEIDGGIHQYQQVYDHERELYLQSLGLKVIRFTNLEVTHNLDGVLEEILRACEPTPSPFLKGGEQPTPDLSLKGGEKEDNDGRHQI